MMGIAFAMCPADRRRLVKWKTIAIGLLLVLLFAVIVLKTPAKIGFEYANTAVDNLLLFTKQGAVFVFGSLSDDKAPTGLIFAFQILTTIIFFAALMSVLYYIRVMPFIVKYMGRGLSKFMGTSGAESFSTVADIFVGQTEAPLVIRPYVETLTLSELNACMTAGFATTAGGVLAAYVGMLNKYVPGIAGHLIACSVMCAPASIVIAKLILPENEQSVTAGNTQIEIPKSATNLFDAIAAGTTDGLKLALNVGAMLLAFIALTAMLNAGLEWIGKDIFNTHLSLERILGWAFAPIAWVMGVPSHDVQTVGTLLGQKTVLTEFVAYSNMSSELAKNPEFLTHRGRLIASYALCGFANFGSIGIQIGGYSGLAESRRGDISRLALRAMIGGALTTCLVACVAGAILDVD